MNEIPGLWTEVKVKQMAEQPKREDGGQAGMVLVSFRVEEYEEMEKE